MDRDALKELRATIDRQNSKEANRQDRRNDDTAGPNPKILFLIAAVVATVLALVLVATHRQTGQQSGPSSNYSTYSSAPHEPAIDTASTPPSDPEPTAGWPLGAEAPVAEAPVAEAPVAEAPVAEPDPAERDPEPQAPPYPGPQVPTEYRGKLSVKYSPTQNADYQQVGNFLYKSQIFHSMAADLSSYLILPRDVDIIFGECGVANAFYDPQHGSLHMCYELMDYYYNLFRPQTQSEEDLRAAIVGATLFVFMHELGHALIHQLDLPITGREEDAADQFATLATISGGKQTVLVALVGAYWFRLSADSDATPYSDEHSLNAQRYYNITCLIYGSDPNEYASLVAPGELPKERAARCPSEFEKLTRSWRNLFGGHVDNSSVNKIIH